jgi:hypothetical protein
MILGTDINGNVLLICDGTDPSIMPTELNGVSLTANTLTDAQEAEYLALPTHKTGTTFIEGASAVIPTPPPTLQQQRDIIQAQIDALETKAIMPRITRETLLALAVQEAAAAGFTEPQLYAMNVGYKRTKDADIIIAALRDKMAAIQ